VPQPCGGPGGRTTVTPAFAIGMSSGMTTVGMSSGNSSSCSQSQAVLPWTLPSGFHLNGVPQDTDPVALQNLLV
jgi:hypothetical protein